MLQMNQVLLEVQMIEMKWNVQYKASISVYNHIQILEYSKIYGTLVPLEPSSFQEERMPRRTDPLFIQLNEEAEVQLNC